MHFEYSYIIGVCVAVCMKMRDSSLCIIISKAMNRSLIQSYFVYTARTGYPK